MIQQAGDTREISNIADGIPRTWYSPHLVWWVVSSKGRWAEVLHILNQSVGAIGHLAKLAALGQSLYHHSYCGQQLPVGE